MSIQVISEDFATAYAILEDVIKTIKIENNEDTNLSSYKLLKAREKNPDFEIELSEMICGESDNSFPYRSSYFLTQFFQNLGYDYTHDGSTRRFWVRDVLKQLSVNDLIVIIQKGLFDKRYFKKYEKKQEDYDSIESYSESINQFKEFINDCFELEKEIDLNFLFDLNVNSKLLFDSKNLVKDEDFNKLVREAKERFINSADKQIAIEKLWDAFERIKTYFGSNKRKSAKKLVEITSANFDSERINNEFKNLTKIGNDYRIRHHETNKKEISDNNTLNYLFFRMMNLLDYCISAINTYENSKENNRIDKQGK